MTKQELKDNIREMVKYILPDECRDDNDILENYTDTMTLISEEYHTNQLKLYNVSNRFDSKYTPPFKVGRKQGKAVLDANGIEVVFLGIAKSKQESTVIT